MLRSLKRKTNQKGQTTCNTAPCTTLNDALGHSPFTSMLLRFSLSVPPQMFSLMGSSVFLILTMYESFIGFTTQDHIFLFSHMLPEVLGTLVHPSPCLTCQKNPPILCLFTSDYKIQPMLAKWNFVWEIPEFVLNKTTRDCRRINVFIRRVSTSGR